MAVSLLEAAKAHTGDVFRAGVIETLGYEGTVLSVLPFTDIPGGSYDYIQEGNLGSVSYRGYNESYPEGTGQLQEKNEKLHVLGGNSDVDRAIVKTHGEGIRDTQDGMKIKAMALSFNRTFIKGDSDANVREFSGLQRRLVGGQLVSAGATAGGNALSLTVLDQAIDAVDGPTHIFMNKAIRRRLSAASRSTAIGGFITYEQDAFGRRVQMYGDLPIVIIDEDETGTQILAFDEASANGGAAVCTSVYVASLSETGLTGIQNGDAEASDLGLLDNGSIFRTNVEWLQSIALMRPKCASRLLGITNAAVVA